MRIIGIIYYFLISASFKILKKKSCFCETNWIYLLYAYWIISQISNFVECCKLKESINITVYE